MLKKALCFVLIATFPSLSLFSQECEEKQKPDLQHEVVVTATRLETPSREVASSVTVITREDFERTRKTSVLEALEEVLGVFILQNGPKGSSASVFLRGANSEHTLVMVDGIELNDPISPSRSFDLAHLTLDDIDRIEVLRGPQSTLYGSDALGGVINIITQKGRGTPQLHLSTYGGSYRTLSASAGMSGGSDKINYSFGLSHLQTQGFSAASKLYENEEKDGYRNLSLSGRLGFQLLENLELDFILRSLKTETEIDNFGGRSGDDPNNTQNYDALFFKGQVRGLFLKNRWEQKLSASLVDYDRRHENLTDEAHPFESEKGFFKSRLFSVDWQNNFFLHETNTLTFGMDYQQEEGKSEYLFEGAWGSSPSFFPRRQARTTGFFLQDQLRVAGRFFATAGARLDSHSQFGSALTFRLGPAYFIEKTQTKLKATFGTGFKSPSLYQLYAPRTQWGWGPIGNRALKPERSVALDFGFEQSFWQGRIFLGWTYFLNEFKDLINFDWIKGFVNIGKAESKGWEFFIQARPYRSLFLNLNYTRTDAKNKVTGEALLRRPKEKYSAGLNYSFKERLDFNISLLYVGQRKDFLYPGPVTLPAYTLVNASISFQFSPNIQVFCRLDNISNETYEVVKGYGTPGFSAYAGVNLLF